jgi:cystathionine beta-lyase
MAFLKDKMPRVKFQRPEGTYIFWMDFNGYNISVEEIKQRIYTNANVVLEPGKMFDPDLGEGFERICLSSPRPIIKKAFYRIHKAFEDLE